LYAQCRLALDEGVRVDYEKRGDGRDRAA
jgi:hypothetical protein